MTTAPTEKPPAFSSYRAVIARTSLSRSSIDRGVKAGWFPKPITLSPGRLAFSTAAIDAWIAERIGDAA